MSLLTIMLVIAGAWTALSLMLVSAWVLALEIGRRSTGSTAHRQLSVAIRPHVLGSCAAEGSSKKAASGIHHRPPGERELQGGLTIHTPVQAPCPRTDSCPVHRSTVPEPGMLR